MIPEEHFEHDLNTQLFESDLHRFYVADNTVPWIVGFYESEDHAEDPDVCVFGTLFNAEGQWVWKITVPEDTETFWIDAKEVSLKDLRPYIAQHKDAHSFEPPTLEFP